MGKTSRTGQTQGELVSEADLGSKPRKLHPRHGIHEPTSGTPVRVPGSVRRTTTIDMLRPEGLDGPLVLAARGRDLHTAVDSSSSVVAEASCRGVVDYAEGRTLQELTTDPVRPQLDALVGTGVASGFRRRLDESDPSLVTEHNLLYLLLDDVPVSTLISGQAFAARWEGGTEPRTEDARRQLQQRAGICAGFAADGTIMVQLKKTGRASYVTGPVAPSLDTNGDAPGLPGQRDPQGWHPTDPLPPYSMRRARRIDVLPGSSAEPAGVDAMFRDSYVLPDGTETVIHEYTLTAEVDPRTRTMTACEARPRVLPWVECPAAAASAGRLAGQRLDGLRRHVRETFSGLSTCTHLNDMLRGLEDVYALWRVTAVGD